MWIGDLIEGIFDAFPFFDNWRFWSCVLPTAGFAIYWVNHRPGPPEWIVIGPVLAVGLIGGSYWSLTAR